MALPGIERDQPPISEAERDPLEREGREVDPQCGPLLAEQRRELIEQPGLSAGPVVLDPRAQARELNSIDPVGLAREPEKREAQRHLERGGRRQPRALGQRRADLQLGRRDRVPGGAELGDDSPRERAPAVHALR